jgi:putative spermidine/putrescine transport system permease protein
MFAATLVALPALVGIGYTFLGAFGIVGPARDAGVGRIARVLSDPAVWSGLAWSVWTAFAATALAFSAAALLAIAFRGTSRLDAVARFIVIAPLPVPHLAAAVMGVLILGQSGLLARVAGALGWIAQPAQMPALIYDVAGIGFVLSMAWKEIPFLALIALTVLAQRGEVWEEAARTLGAGPWKTLRLVTWPALWRGMLPGATAAFVFVAGTFEATALLAPSRPLPLSVLQVERYTDANLARRGDAYVIALLFFALAAFAVIVHEWSRARTRDAT